jgi:SSS family solute:Na+ symporter
MTLATACATKAPPAAHRRQLVQLLQREAESGSGWVRVHAAEALLDHGQVQTPARLFAGEADTAAPPYRVGVWRIMARAAGTDAERRIFRERIRAGLLDTHAPDRLHAAESLAKLGLSQRVDRPALENWAATADDANSAYVLWLLVLSGNPSERAASDARLATLLNSTNPVARLRAAFALGRIDTVSRVALDRLNRQSDTEPADSPARPYLLAAGLLHAARDASSSAKLRRQLAWYLANGKANEQLEAATVLGRCGATEEIPELTRLLQSPEADARIGAASGLLYLLP